MDVPIFSQRSFLSLSYHLQNSPFKLFLLFPSLDISFPVHKPLFPPLSPTLTLCIFSSLKPHHWTRYRVSYQFVKSNLNWGQFGDRWCIPMVVPCNQVQDKATGVLLSPFLNCVPLQKGPPQLCAPAKCACVPLQSVPVCLCRVDFLRYVSL